VPKSLGLEIARILLALSLLPALLVIGEMLVFGIPAWVQHLKAEHIRPAAMQETVVRAQPILRAISDYQKATGHPPETIEALVPTYLNRIPDAGPMAEHGWRFETERRSEAGGWALYVRVRREYSSRYWGLGDTFVFHPNGRYARYDYSGVLVDRVGRWAYYYE